MGKRTTKDTTIILLFLFCSVACAAAFGLKRIFTVDFFAINGDFQNYNVFRRLLDGQLPYTDFANYLGMGVLLLNLPFLLFSNSFASSLFITNFSTCLIYIWMVTLVVYLITKHKPFAFLMGSFAPLFEAAAGEIPFLDFLTEGFYLVYPGNSMRTTRAFLPFLLVGLFLLTGRLFLKRGTPPPLTARLFRPRFLLILGFVLGGCFLWSNDFGAACLASAFGLLILLYLLDREHRWRKKAGGLLLFVLSASVGFLCCAMLVTRGHLTDYLRFTAGVADYQFWYYGLKMNKILTLPEVFSDPMYVWMWVWFTAALGVFLFRVVKKRAEDFDLLLMFVYLSTMTASLIYLYGSGHYAYEGLFLTTTLLVGATLCLPLVKAVVRHVPQLFVRCCIIGLCALLLFNSTMIWDYAGRLDNQRSPRYAYVAQMRGWTKYGSSILYAADYIGDAPVFSTYASALELVTGQFQPTGVDYIIHTMGDGQRQRYLDAFLTGNYPYVTTIRGDYDRYEYWARRTNWFFYRELYRRYRPSAITTDYALIWEKASGSNLVDTPSSVILSRLTDASQRILVTLPEHSGKVIADLKISYRSSWTKDRWKEMAYKRVVSVWDGGEKFFTKDNNECYFLPPESEETYIPLVIEDGRGTLDITVFPTCCTKLEDLQVEVVGLIDHEKVTVSWTEYDR